MSDLKITLPLEMTEELASQIATLVAKGVQDIIEQHKEKLLPEEDVCKQLKVTKRTMYNYRQKGLRASKFGKDIFYLNTDLIKFHNDHVR